MAPPSALFAPNFGVWISVNPCACKNSRKPLTIPSWILNFARSLTLRSVIGRIAILVSKDVFNFHLLIAIGIGSAGSDNTLIVFKRISIPFGALSSFATTPSTSIVDASFKSLILNSVTPSSYTHCNKPSLLRSTTNATSPISRIVCTAPFTFTVCPNNASSSNCVISNVSFWFTPCINSMFLFLLKLNPFPNYDREFAGELQRRIWHDVHLPFKSKRKQKIPKHRFLYTSGRKFIFRGTTRIAGISGLSYA